MTSSVSVSARVHVPATLLRYRRAVPAELFRLLGAHKASSTEGRDLSKADPGAAHAPKSKRAPRQRSIRPVAKPNEPEKARPNKALACGRR